MPAKNPITDAMLTLYENQYATRQAQLDYERARTREQVYAKGAVKGVVSELAEIEMKKQKQKEAIEKSGQSQANPQAMVPPTIDVTGQTSGRDMSGAFKSASEIAQLVSGGAGIKQGAIGGGFGQTGPPQPGSPGVSPGIPQPQGQPAAQPAPGQAVPGQSVPVQQPVSGLERWVGGPLQMIVGAAGRSPGAVVAGLHEMSTGMRDAGFEQLPTVEKMGKDLSQTLWAAQEGLTGSAASLNDQFQRIAGRYGPEVSKQVANAALTEAAEVERQQQLFESDPKRVMAKQQQRLLAKAEVEFENLTPGELFVLQGMRKSSTSTTNIENKIMMPSTQADIEKDVWGNQDFVQALNEIDRNFYPDYYTLLRDQGQLPNAGRRIYARLGLDLSPEGKEKLGRFASFDQSLGGISLETAHRLLGAQMTPYELQRFDRAFQGFSQATDAISGRASLDQMREMVGLSTLRRAHALMMPRTATSNPGDWVKLGDGRDLALNDVATRIEQLEAGGVESIQAEQQAFWEMKNAYGLDVSHWPEFQRAPQSTQ